jgi:hypothetical protein
MIRELQSTNVEYRAVAPLSDLMDLNEEDSEGSLEIEGPRRLLSDPRDLTIRELFSQEQEGELKLQPEFQRFYVFDDPKASRLIESVLMSVPLPLIYLAEEADSTFTVIDGQQRLTSFFRYLRNEFKLSRLTIFPEYNGKYFRDLPAEMQRILRNSSVRCIIIKRESDPNVKFEIFERLNTGSVKLNDQELRNCIYRGHFNQMLRDLSASSEWLRLLGRAAPDNRMTDREMILRFFALYLDFNQYQPPMKRFLNQAMESRQHMTEAQSLQLRDLFRRTAATAHSVFGDKAFKRYEPGYADRPGGAWSRETRINMALFDVIMTSFARYEQRDIIPFADAIREALIDLMATNREFTDAITLGTSQRNRLLTRMDIWNNRLREVLGNPQAEPRLFSRQFRQDLFNLDPECTICRQLIVSIDDAAVDHLLPYSFGGSTTPANGRLAHRYCNAARGNRT